MVRSCTISGVPRRGIPRILLIIAVFLISLFSTCSTTAEGTAEQPKAGPEEGSEKGPKEEMQGEESIRLEESYLRFRSLFDDSYTAELGYSAFSPHRGTWRITVQEGTLLRWEFQGKENIPEYQDFAENLRMETLYKRAAEDSRLELSYDGSGILHEIVFPADGKGPTDRGYRIRILSIKKRNNEQPGE